VTAFQAFADLLGRKWHISILYHLSCSGSMRFHHLEEEINGISAKMLSESLDRLETQYGLVERTVISDSPIQVEYSLTEHGELLVPLISEIAAWTRENRSIIDQWVDARDHVD
jgi:DNA-binding HxlR family transcriptional regulator